MNLLLPEEITDRLEVALRKARSQEIGGLLMGEHVGGDTFRVVDISVQTLHGTHSSFERDPAAHRQQLDAFFERTGGDYARFNYLGEWHSHPSFEPLPSRTDVLTMLSIVRNPDVGVNFAVLIIARLERRRRLAMSATVFVKNGPPQAAHLSVDRSPKEGSESLLGRIRKMLTNAVS